MTAMWSSAFPASHQTSVSVVSLWTCGKPICQTALEGKQREKPHQQPWLSNRIPKTRIKKDNAKRRGDETEYDTSYHTPSCSSLTIHKYQGGPN